MLDPTQVQSASTAVRELRVALSNFFLYTNENTMVQRSVDRLLVALGLLFEEFPSITIGESEGRLVVEGTPLDERLTGSTNMIKDVFLTHELHSLTFFKGVTAEETKTLFGLLRPKALPVGLSLSQAMVQHSLEHIRANEKVFVAVSEGEVVVQADMVAGAGTGEVKEQNLQEALEALQYFLQIFARVKPDSNKKEVAQRLMENMGSWLGVEGGGSGRGPGAGAQKAWSEALGGFLSLKNNLSAIQKPADVKSAKESLEDLLRKLVGLAESQGVSVDASALPSAGDAGGPAPQARTEEPEEPGLDAILEGVAQGNLEPFFDPESEEKAGQALARLQEADRKQAFQTFWDGLWNKMDMADEKTQVLLFRHLNRLQWGRMPRDLQKQGFLNLRRFLLETRRAPVFPFALSLAQDWVPQEMAKPDWDEIFEVIQALKRLAARKPSYFDKQNLASKVALETIFCEPVLSALLVRYQPGSRDGEGLRKCLTALGNLATPFLFQVIEKEPVESENWKKSVDLLNAFQAEGQHIYEFWLEWPEKRAHLEKFLEIFLVTSLPGEIADYFERHWNSFGPGAQLKILDIIEKGKLSSFRGLLTSLLGKPDTPQAFRALLVLGEVGQGGCGAAIVESVKKYPLQGKERDAYWVRACQVLRRLSDPAALPGLMEWADRYKLFGNKKDRSLEVRRAAIEALGAYPSPEVQKFLVGLRKEGEKELGASLEEALKAVNLKMTRAGRT